MNEPRLINPKLSGSWFNGPGSLGPRLSGWPRLCRSRLSEAGLSGPKTKWAPVKPALGEAARVELAELKKPGLSGPSDRWGGLCVPWLSEHELSWPLLF